MYYKCFRQSDVFSKKFRELERPDAKVTTAVDQQSSNILKTQLGL